jgi:hypothetical protein
VAKLAPQWGKTCAIRRQTCGKSLYYTPKKYKLLQKNNIHTAKKAISTFSHTLGTLFSFLRTVHIKANQKDNYAAVRKPV